MRRGVSAKRAKQERTAYEEKYQVLIATNVGILDE
jgi:hypothetical protein